MPYDKYDKFFRSHPVFTGHEFTAYMRSMGEVGQRTQETNLAYHRDSGRIVQVRRGLYAVVPKDLDPSKFKVDPYLVAAKLTADAVLTYHTALEFHGRAYSTFERYTYTSSKPCKLHVFQSREFRGVTTPSPLKRSNMENMGVEARDREGMPVRVSTLERTFVDVLDRQDISGSWEEIWRSLESVEYYDLESIIKYALLLGNATTVAKVGFFLEQHRESLMVEDYQLRQLQELRPKQPHYLNRSQRKSGRLITQWKLVVPQEVIERAWAEVV